MLRVIGALVADVSTAIAASRVRTQTSQRPAGGPRSKLAEVPSDMGTICPPTRRHCLARHEEPGQRGSVAAHYRDDLAVQLDLIGRKHHGLHRGVVRGQRDFVT